MGVLVRYTTYMHEIEIKGAVRNKEETLKRLSDLGCVFSAPVSQDDTVYSYNVGSIAVFVENPVFVRIRVQDNGKIRNL